MISFAVVLSLAALATSYPATTDKIQQLVPHVENQPILQENQQQGVSDDAINVIPFYNIYSRNAYTSYPQQKVYSGVGQNVPVLSKSSVHPSRSNYFLRYLSKPAQVYYDTQDVYYDDIDQPLVNQGSGYGQQLVRKIQENVDTPYLLPYSPSYYGSSQINALRQGYPRDMYYGKNLNLDYVQSWANSKYGKQWDMDYIRRFFGRNLNQATPVTKNFGWEAHPENEQISEYLKPELERNLGIGHVEPATIEQGHGQFVHSLKNYGNRQSVLPRNLGIEGVHILNKYPFADYYHGMPSSIDSIRGYYGRNLNLEHVSPLKQGKMFRGEMDETKFGFGQPLISENIEQSHPVISENQGIEVARNINFEKKQPINNLGLKVEPYGEVTVRQVQPVITKTSLQGKPVPLSVQDHRNAEFLRNLGIEVDSVSPSDWEQLQNKQTWSQFINSPIRRAKQVYSSEGQNVPVLSKWSVHPSRSNYFLDVDFEQPMIRQTPLFA